MMGRPSNDASLWTTGSPPMISDASRLVPPMSIVIRSSSSVAAPNEAAPITPPAGPERMRFTGASLARLAVIAPPPERIMKNRPENSSSAKLDSKRVMYRRTSGRI